MRERIQIPSLVWKDTWFQGLSVREKLLFLYLLSNGHSLICGCYSELSKKRIRVDTRIELTEIEHILEKFHNDGQVFYSDGKVEIVNSVRFYYNEQRLRLTPQYKNWRNAVLKRDNYTCQNCGNKTKKLHIHHIKSFANYSDLRIDINNGTTLCEECHKTLHQTKEAKNER